MKGSAITGPVGKEAAELCTSISAFLSEPLELTRYRASSLSHFTSFSSMMRLTVCSVSQATQALSCEQNLLSVSNSDGVVTAVYEPVH